MTLYTRDPSADRQNPVDDSILVDDADPDAIAVDDLGSDISLDEDAVPVRKVTANNKVSLMRSAHGLWLISAGYATAD